MKSLDKLKKFAEGGVVRKYQNGDELSYTSLADRINVTEQEQQALKDFDEALDDRRALRLLRHRARMAGDDKAVADATEVIRETYQTRRNNYKQSRRANLKQNLENFEDTMSSPEAQMGIGIASKGLDVLDNGLMGDKNFGAQSQAIDGAVDMASNALMQSGNPYCMVAAAALKGANFLTKAGGQTVQGFDVDINSSGYGEMGHMSSSSSRDFGAMIGLGGLNQGKMQAKLQKRNQQAMMAMNAANIAEEQTFEQEARMNSIQNTVMNNQIALSGGLETNLLGG